MVSKGAAAMDLPTLGIGDRIRHHRRRANRRQAVLAGLCGISEDYLSQIERGERTPSGEVLIRIAAELGVHVAVLLGDPMVPAGTAAPPTADADVVGALLGTAPPAGPRPAALLRARVEEAWLIWQTSPERFTRIEPLLPDLVGAVGAAVRAPCAPADAAERREALRAAADLYGLLRSYCRRTGRVDLSLLCADRALRAAEDADDPLRIAAARWNLGQVLLARPGQEEAAREVALRAAENLDKECRGRSAAALRGALELIAALAEARTRRVWVARERLHRRVLPLAARTGEHNTLWTVFGPTNVSLHAVSIEMTDGDAAEGLRTADRIDPGRLPSRERRFTFALEVAACYHLRREDPAVLAHLLELEQLAPQDLLRSPLARELLLSLLRRARPLCRRQATDLAERLRMV
ncbi:helix-turn-helix domain-containing protein [Streptomyces minutiscleroticus]|uniref:helix-turn-helix domain-containing protein n=1 Tax=Streptomyces minutiscleroticus TaxID=68238 RepID=UPI00332C98B5